MRRCSPDLRAGGEGEGVSSDVLSQTEILKRVCFMSSPRYHGMKREMIHDLKMFRVDNM